MIKFIIGTLLIINIFFILYLTSQVSSLQYKLDTQKGEKICWKGITQIIVEDFYYHKTHNQRFWNPDPKNQIWCFYGVEMKTMTELNTIETYNLEKKTHDR